MKRTSVVLWSLAALTVVGAAALSARAKTPAQLDVAANNPGPAPVSLAKVESVKSAPREEITGALQPAKALQVGFEVSGRLARILVKKGSLVGEGQVIAQLDPELADAQVQQAEAAVKAAEAQSAMASDTARRQGELQQSGSVSEWQSKSSGATATAAAAQLQAARAQLAQARAARRRHDLKAPFAGVLIDAPDQVGATVAPGAALFTLEQLDPLVLKLTVSDAARAVLKPGTRVHVEAVGGGAAASDAWVSAVIPSADPATRRIPVEITVPNKEGRFTAHTLARAVLPMGSAEDALSLPASALSSQGGDHVYVIDGAFEVRRVAVQVIDRGVQQVVVRAAQAIDKVVDYPAADLVDGAKVSVR
jgi:RND family efflux transporter MFP subunit